MNRYTALILLTIIAGCRNKDITITYPKDVLDKKKELSYEAALWCAYTYNLSCLQSNTSDSMKAVNRKRNELFLSHGPKLEYCESFKSNTLFKWSLDFKDKKIQLDMYGGGLYDFCPLIDVYVSNSDNLIDSVVDCRNTTFASVMYRRSNSSNGTFTTKIENSRQTSRLNYIDSCKIRHLINNKNILNNDLMYLCIKRKIFNL